MRLKFFILTSFLLMALFIACPCQNVWATENTSMEPKVISIDKETGITVYQDAAGGLVFSGLQVPFTASKKEQLKQILMIEEYEKNLPSLNKAEANTRTTPYVDYENNPIYIGTSNNEDCYARHTLGSYNSSTQYLTSYGSTSWYNTSGLQALPYRNGATNNGANQGVVAKYSYFSIRDLDEDQATTIQISDWGPSQDAFPNRIADLDRNTFSSLHGNYSDGVLYSRTYVPINNYNP